MDLRCRHCGEPVEIDHLHDVLADTPEAYRTGTYEEDFTTLSRNFAAKGCAALGEWCNPDTKASPIIGALTDLLGDDIDGAAAILEDAEYMGYDLYGDGDPAEIWGA